MTTTLKIRRPDDFHVHLRQGEMTGHVLPHTAKHFGRAVVMPNTEPAILTGEDAVRYHDEIQRQNPNADSFKPLMTIKITPETTPEIIYAAKAAGVTAGKLLPDGVTTNSQGGVRDFEALSPSFEAMQEVGMVLCVHGEMPGKFVLDREYEFMGTLFWIVRTFPKLKVVLEHVTSERTLKLISSLPDNLAATITVHHLMLTLDDVIGGMLQPHHFCKPVAKRPEDRAALRKAATSGDPRFFLGTDSAPHLRGKKECASGCAGVFTAPVALPLLAQVFEEEGALEKLEAFTSEHGARFYGLPLNKGTVTLERVPWTVPEEYDGVVPLCAGQTINWRAGRFAIDTVGVNRATEGE